MGGGGPLKKKKKKPYLFPPLRGYESIFVLGDFFQKPRLLLGVNFLAFYSPKKKGIA